MAHGSTAGVGELSEGQKNEQHRRNECLKALVTAVYPLLHCGQLKSRPDLATGAAAHGTCVLQALLPPSGSWTYGVSSGNMMILLPRYKHRLCRFCQSGCDAIVAC
jgi:hypothetical protein